MVDTFVYTLCICDGINMSMCLTLHREIMRESNVWITWICVYKIKRSYIGFILSAIFLWERENECPGKCNKGSNMLRSQWIDNEKLCANSFYVCTGSVRTDEYAYEVFEFNGCVFFRSFFSLNFFFRFRFKRNSLKAAQPKNERKKNIKKWKYFELIYDRCTVPSAST